VWSDSVPPVTTNWICEDSTQKTQCSFSIPGLGGGRFAAARNHRVTTSKIASDRDNRITHRAL